MENVFTENLRGVQIKFQTRSGVFSKVERLFEKYFKNCTMVAHGREYVVLKATK